MDILALTEQMPEIRHQDLRACISETSLVGLSGTALANWVLGIEMADGGKKIGSRIPNWHTDWLFGKLGRQEECAYITTATVIWIGPSMTQHAIFLCGLDYRGTQQLVVINDLENKINHYFGDPNGTKILLYYRFRGPKLHLLRNPGLDFSGFRHVV